MTKNWKRTGYLIPDVIEPEENICICVPVPKDWGHINAFLGQITELAKWLTWEKDGTDSALRSARRWMEITQCVIDGVNEAMASNCGCGCDDRIPTNQRYTEDGHLEVSYDNGATWENADATDPRFNSPIFSPLPGADGSTKRCKGANSVIAILKDEQAKSSAILDAATGLTALITAVAGYVASTGVGLLVGAILALMSGVLTLIINQGEAAFTASFGGTTWDDLLCILFCEMEDDGTFTEAGWETVVTKAGELANYPANEWLAHMIKVIGPVGLTNASLTGAAGSLSCDGCDCDAVWCYLFDFNATMAQQGWSEWVRATGGGGTSHTTWTGSGWQSEPTGGAFPFNDDIQSSIKRAFTDTFVTSVTINWSGGNSSLNYGCRVQVLKSDNTTQEFNSNGVGMFTKVQAINLTVKEIRVSIEQSGTQSGYPPAIIIDDVTFEGDGENPIGVDNCPEE
jgi:hypothetical protein